MMLTQSRSAVYAVIDIGLSDHRLLRYSVVERARPRTRRADESLGVNHGGVAIIAAAGVRLSPVSYTHLTLPTIYSV